MAWDELTGVPAPVQARETLRRTVTLDTVWPDGPGRAHLISARGRDVVRLADGARLVIGAQHLEALIAPAGEVLSLSASPPCGDVASLAGLRAGRGLRAALARHGDLQQAQGSLVSFLLDDLAGANLVSPWALACWYGGYPAVEDRSAEHAPPRSMEGICIGFAKGAGTLDSSGRPRQDIQNSRLAGCLVHPEDPEGWHEFPEVTGPSMRRARWCDIRLEGDGVAVEAGFQDSGLSREAGRMAVHEYAVSAVATGDDLRLVRISAQPSVLPYQACWAAPGGIGALCGRALGGFRQEVPERLGAEAGCTHLNDILRSLSDVPCLAASLQAVLGTGGGDRKLSNQVDLF